MPVRRMSMWVSGGSPVDLGLGQLFARLGTRVTIAEALDRLAPSAEPEVSAAIEDVFDDEGIGILTAATVVSVQRRSEEHTSELQSHLNLVCRLLLEKKKKHRITYTSR